MTTLELLACIATAAVIVALHFYFWELTGRG